jgi:hypothetical protein
MPYRGAWEFVHEVVADSSRADITLNFPGQFHFGFVMKSVTLSAIAGLKLDFGIEIFPESSGPAVVGDASAGVPLRVVGN